MRWQRLDGNAGILLMISESEKRQVPFYMLMLYISQLEKLNNIGPGAKISGVSKTTCTTDLLPE